MARKYDMQSTKDFLVGTIILAALALWFIKDGWFPSAAVLEHHPRQVSIQADVDGMVAEVFVAAGTTVASNQPAIRLVPFAASAPSVLKTPTKGDVIGVLAKKSEDVKRDQDLILIHPQDSFYAFNKSVAILFMLGAAVCAIIHKAIR